MNYRDLPIREKIAVRRGALTTSKDRHAATQGHFEASVEREVATAAAAAAARDSDPSVLNALTADVRETIRDAKSAQVSIMLANQLSELGEIHILDMLTEILDRLEALEERAYRTDVPPARG